MEAKDTVMSIAELVEVRFRYNNLKLNLPRCEAKKLRWDRYLAEAQAEITAPIFFKAGIKEVLEWLGYYAKKYDMRIDGFVIPWTDWLEWEILREDKEIADNMRDYWTNKADGAE